MTSFQKDFDKELLNFFSEWKVLADYCDVSSLRDTSVVAVLVGNGRNGAKDVAPSLANAYKKLGKNNLAVVYIHELDGKGCGTGCDTGCMSKCASKRVDKAFEEAMPVSWIKVSDPEGALLDNLCKAVDDVISENLFLISGDVTQVISDDAGFLVYKNEEHGFPWTAEAIKEADDKKQAALESLRSSVFGTPGLKFLTDIPLYRHSPEEIVEVQSLLDCDLIGILFAADWSLPSQALIPRLAELYSGLLSAGKKIEIILVSSDENINVFEDHFSKMPWLAVRYTERDSRRQLSEIFKVSSVPTFVWVDVKSGEQLAVDGLETVTVGCEYFPWGDEQMATGRQDAITKSHSSTRLETHDLWKQNSQIILRDCRHHAEIEQDYTICFNEFATVIGEVQLQVGGKYYFEIEVVDIDYCPGAQLGWSSEGFKDCKEYSDDGVGDDDVSWGFDGVRREKWGNSDSQPWGGPWQTGDVLGLAADLSVDGSISLSFSVNGSFSAPNGVAFDSISAPWLAPALSAQEGVFRVNFGENPFRFSAPDGSFSSVHESSGTKANDSR